MEQKGHPTSAAKEYDRKRENTVSNNRNPQTSDKNPVFGEKTATSATLRKATRTGAGTVSGIGAQAPGKTKDQIPHKPKKPI